MTPVHGRHTPPNYVNPPTRPPGVQATCIVYMVLLVGMLALRFYTRLRFGHRLGFDDLFAASATAFAASAYILVLVMEQDYGFNRHSWDIPPHMYREAIKLDWIYDELFVQAACQAKLSLLFFCWRLIGRALQRVQSTLMIGLMAFVVFCQIMFVIVSVLECRPLKAVWDQKPDYPHTCFKVDYFLMIAGLINTATDIACTLFPILIVLRLEMPLRRRIGVASVFVVGFSANIASCLRIYYAYREGYTGDVWNQMQSFIAGNSEIGLGLLCVSAPVIRPLITHLLSCGSYYTHVYATNSTRRGYGFGRTNADLNYASDTRITKADDRCDSKPIIVKSADRGLWGGETDMEAAVANADSWRATTVELEMVPDAHLHHYADSDLDSLGRKHSRQSP